MECRNHAAVPFAWNVRRQRRASRVIVRQVCVFVLIQPHLVPDRYGASRRFETTPSIIHLIGGG
jgi:hypothetical protein